MNLPSQTGQSPPHRSDGKEAAPSERVFADSMRTLKRALRGSIITNIVAASLLAIAMIDWYPGWLLATWLLGLVLAQTWRLLLKALLARVRPLQPKISAVKKARRFELDAFMLAAYWGASSVFFFNPEQSLQPFYWALVLGGTAAGSIGAHAHHPRTMWIFLPTLIVPFSLCGLLEPSSDSRFLGAGMLLLLAYLLYYGKQHALTLKRMIELRHENSGLVEELQSQTLALHEANAAKSRFFAAASHDLRQPLQAMSLYLSVVSSGDNNPQALTRMSQCMESLDRLLEVVMDISRLDAGQVTPHIEHLCIATVLDRLANMYEVAAHQKGLQLRIHPTSLWTKSDPALLERMLSNLVSNAIRYTEKGGVVLAARLHNGVLKIMVRDTGIGIPVESHQTIFEEFVQLNNYARDSTQGTGLGLATVQRLALLLEHRVTLTSRLGRGTAFSLQVPWVPAPANGGKSEAPHPIDRLPLVPAFCGDALVVEDNPMVRTALVALLTRWGLDVVAVDNAGQALAALQTQQFDVVLSDWRLPGEGDGLTVLRQAHLCQPHLLLAVLMTGEDAQRMPDAPANIPVLRKPVRPLRLRALLQAHLQGNIKRMKPAQRDAAPR